MEHDKEIIEAIKSAIVKTNRNIANAKTEFLYHSKKYHKTEDQKHASKALKASTNIRKMNEKLKRFTEQLKKREENV
jgi:hypothetical protein